MDVNTRTAFFKHTQGLLTSLLLSSVLVLCTSTPIPPQEQLHPRRHYDRLVRDTEILYEHHHTVYTDFKTVRHSDSAIRVVDFTIDGVPNVQSLPNPATRSQMQESELLPIHYTRLQAFEQAVALAMQDEFSLMLTGNNNFHGRMREVLVLLQRVIAKLRQTMVRLEITHDYDSTPSITFTSNTNQSILSMRILFVMQELSDHLVPTLQDFVNFKNSHVES